MAIELIEQNVCRTDLIGDDNFELTAGQELKVEGPQEDILRAVCPAGKKWSIHVAVVIEETDI